MPPINKYAMFEKLYKYSEVERKIKSGYVVGVIYDEDIGYKYFVCESPTIVFGSTMLNNFVRESALDKHYGRTKEKAIEKYNIFLEEKSNEILKNKLK